jgi:hypothetical protein
MKDNELSNFCFGLAHVKSYENCECEYICLGEDTPISKHWQNFEQFTHPLDLECFSLGISTVEQERSRVENTEDEMLKVVLTLILVL